MFGEEGSTQVITRGSVSLLGFVVLVTVIVGSVLTDPTAQAYSTEGIRWQHNVGIPYTMQSMQSYDTQAFNDGMNAWNNSVAPIIFYGSGTQEVIESDTNAGASGWDGITDWSASTLNCNYPLGYNRFYQVYTQLNYYYTKNESSSDRQGVAAHELGHAIGLGHTSVTNAVMYPTTGIRAITPQSDDINGADYIYAQSC